MTLLKGDSGSSSMTYEEAEAKAESERLLEFSG
jgi:hypothetical protein